MNIWTNREWTPMLLKETDKAFDSKDYIFEVKFDGIRAILYVGKNDFVIFNRHKKKITSLYPELKEIQKLVTHNTILDGEIIALENRNPSFEKLQKRAHLKDKNKIKIQSKLNPVLFVVFDILYQNKDLTKLPLIKRKYILNTIKENDFLIISKSFQEKGIQLFSNIVKKNLEGIVAKRIDSTYQINKRSDDWIKIKNQKIENFLIGGYEMKNNGVLSILLGELINTNLFYVGSASLYKSHPLYKEILMIPKKKTSPFINYERVNAIYILPKLKIYVKYMERTKTKHLRQPVIIK